MAEIYMYSAPALALHKRMLTDLQYNQTILLLQTLLFSCLIILLKISNHLLLILVIIAITYRLTVHSFLHHDHAMYLQDTAISRTSCRTNQKWHSFCKSQCTACTCSYQCKCYWTSCQTLSYRHTYSTQ